MASHPCDEPSVHWYCGRALPQTSLLRLIIAPLGRSSCSLWCRLLLFMTTASIPQCKPMSGGCWCRLPGRAGGYPASPPTDPYVRNERIRVFGHQSFGTTLAHHCAALHARSDVVDDLGYGQGIPSQKLLEFLPPDTARAAAPTQPVSPRFLRVTGHALQHAEVSSKPVVRKMPTSLQAEHLVLVFHGSVTVGATPSPQGLLGAT